MREWYVNTMAKMTEAERKALEPFFALSDEARKHIYDMEVKYRIFTVAAGNAKEFDEVKSKLLVTPADAKEIGDSRSVNEFGKADSLVSRLPSSSLNGRIFMDLAGNQRAGEPRAFLNLFDEERPFAVVPLSDNNSLYVSSIEWLTRDFKAYVGRKFPTFVEHVPELPSLMGSLSDEDFDNVNDWQVSVKDDDKSIAIVPRTRGGAIYGSRNGGKQPNYYDVGGFARMIFTGKPRVFVMKHAYEYCKPLRLEIDGELKVKNEARKQDMTDHYSSLVGLANELLSYRFEGVSGPDLKVFPPEHPGEKALTRSNMKELFFLVNQINRDVIKVLSGDQSILRNIMSQLNAFVSNDIFVRAICDQVCSGATVDTNYSYNYVNAGYLVRTSPYCRSSVTTNDAVGVDNLTLRHFDPAPLNNRRYLVDGEFLARKLWIGGTEWEDKVTPTPAQQKKWSYTWADYEPVWESVEPPKDDPQSVVVDRCLLALANYDAVFFICPLRRLEKLVNDPACNIFLAVPAPAPALMCALVGVSRLAIYPRVPRVVVVKLLRYVFVLLRGVRQFFVCGSKNIRKMFRSQYSPDTVCPTLIKPWAQLMRDRHASLDKFPGLFKYLEKIDYLVKNDSASVTKASVQRLEQRETLLDDQFRFVFGENRNDRDTPFKEVF